ncbi:MAG: class I tRNA ligase family protein, partial [Bacteroidia bacterium]|nr:class I tRNA ligase family protein [Bacteroidia bacterium]MDW8135138.1 class I tRNA ligase family protein [Bacteroidia bacterium]
IWEQFCSWYLEALKPAPALSLLEKVEAQALRLLQLIHPFMPYITEELWHQMQDLPAHSFITNHDIKPIPREINWQLLDAVLLAQVAISRIRELKQTFGLSEITKLATLNLQSKFFPTIARWLQHFLGASIEPQLKPLSDRVIRLNVRTVGVSTTLHERIHLYQEVFFVYADISEDKWKNLIAMLYKEQSHALKFREMLLAKLQNPDFLHKAPPEIIEKERKKLEDTEARLRLITEQLEAMGVESAEKK